MGERRQHDSKMTPILISASLGDASTIGKYLFHPLFASISLEKSVQSTNFTLMNLWELVAPQKRRNSKERFINALLIFRTNMTFLFASVGHTKTALVCSCELEVER